MSRLTALALPVAALGALAGCDFDGAYDRCVQEGRCLLPGVPVKLAFLSAAQVQHVGGCSAPVTVQALDAEDVAARPAEGVLLQLSGPAGAVELFSDSFCETRAAEVPFDGAAVATFFFAGLTPGTHRLEVSAGALPPQAQDARVLATGIASLAFVNAPAQLLAGSCSSAIQVEQRDASGAAAAAPAALRYTLASNPAGGVTFHGDSRCQAPVGDVSIPAGQTAAVTWISSRTAGDMQLRASGIAVTPATAPVRILPGVATRIAFTTPPVQVASRECSPGVQVTAQDAFGNPAAVSAATQVSLSSVPPGLTFHASGACGPALSSVTIPAGGTTAAFSFSGQAAGMYQLTATTGALGSAQQAATVGAGGAAALAFITPPRALVAGACSPALTVELRDAAGNVVTAGGGLQLALSAGATPGVTFFTDAQCQAAATTAQVPPGGSSATFHFIATRAGPLNVTASAAPLTPATQAQQVAPGPVTALAFNTAPRRIPAGACSGQVTLQLRDAFGNPAAAAANLPVQLASSSGSTQFFSNLSCSANTSTVTIPAGASQVTFAFAETKAGLISITATAQGLPPATQDQTIDPGPPNVLAILSAPQTVTAGSCSGPVRMQIQDLYGNPAIAPGAITVNVGALPPGSPGAVSFYGRSDCGGGAGTAFSIPAGASEVSLHFTGTTAQTFTLLASTSFAFTQQDETIVPGPIAAVSFVTPPHTVLAGLCSPAVRVQTVDAFGNLNATPAQVSFAAPGLTVYGDSTCQSVASAVPTQNGEAQVHFSGATGGPQALQAFVGALPPTTQTETIAPLVRAVSCSAGNGSTLSCPVSPPVLDLNRSFAVFQVSSPGSTPADSMFACGLTSPSALTCRRGNNNGPFSVSAHVVEHRNAKVQHFEEPCSLQGTPPLMAQVVNLIPAVDPAQSFVLVSAFSGGTVLSDNDTVLAALSSPTTVTIRSSAGCPAGMRFRLQVVELAGATVTRGSTSMTGASATVSGLPLADLSRTFLLASWRASGGIAPSICVRAINGGMSSASSVVFTRGDGSTACQGDPVEEIAWERIQLPAGSRVQTAGLKMPASILTATQPLITVDLTRTFALSSGMSFAGAGLGEGSLSSDDAIGEVLARHTLNGTNQLVLNRSSAGGSASFTSSAVELQP